MMRTTRTLATVLFLTTAASCVGDASPSPTPVAAPAAAPVARTVPGGTAAARAAARLGALGVTAAAIDADGTPRLLRATTAMPAPIGATAEVAARAHLATLAPALGVSADALSTLQLRRVHALPGGAHIAVFRPQVDGLEIYRGDVAVLMRGDGSLVAVNGAPRADALPGARIRSRDFVLTSVEAVATALAQHSGLPITAADLRPLGVDAHGDLRFALATSAGYATAQTMRARQVLLAAGPHLVPAWWVEGWAPRRGGGHVGVFDSAIDARDGRVRVHEDRSAAEAATFRVWQSGADKRPTDGPIADFTPHPTGVPDDSTPAFIAPTLTSIAPFNHNPAGGADPWLAPNAPDSNGNNVDAYTDNEANGGTFSAGDIRAAATSANTFDYTYGLGTDPQASANQKMAAITQLFYTTNWLHDYWYDSGFDEASGNAQQDNYGRGGMGGDPLQAQAQDSAAMGQRNNANMDAASDGQSPTMQMYLWSGADNTTATLTPGGAKTAVGAAFGPPSFDVTGAIVLANDGSGTTTDACEPLTNNVTGKIVLIDRGTCQFALKAVAAQNAGAIAVMIANNQAGGAIAMPQSNPQSSVTIPSVSISMEDGAALKTALGGGAVSVALHRLGAVERDGDLDNSVVAHEWGHYLHLRLAACGAQQCAAMSEGWADFVSIHQTLREGDNLDGTYAAAQYAAAGIGSAYFGIRRAPYAHDLLKNPFTFKHISDGTALPTTAPLNGSGGNNSEVHNAGEIWAEMMFEGYTALLRETLQPGATRTFTQVRRTMADYVVAGLEMTPPDATYTEQRDAVLAAAAAINPADAATLAAAFARRGAGSCAVSPPSDSTDFTGVVEDFNLSPTIDLSNAALDEATLSCDNDGVLDAGEAGHLTIKVSNTGSGPLTGATLTATTTLAGVTLPTAPIAVPDLAPFASTTVSFTVALDDTVAPQAQLDIAIAIDAPGACTTTSGFAVHRGVNLDVKTAASATDTVETPATQWTAAGDTTGVWARVEGDAGGHVWRGADLASQSDTSLASPDLIVSATDPLVVTFSERHDFEASKFQGQLQNFDGGVIEITTDGGTTWTDVGAMAQPGYGGALGTMSNNPIGGRQAFVGQSAGYPAMQAVTLNLGTAYAGKTVRLRFRIGTDQGTGAGGWDLDDLAFTGITNTPFDTIVNDPPGCTPAAGSDAGVDPKMPAPGGCCDASGSQGGSALALGGFVALAFGRRRRRRA
jgi:hypothetical protein